MTVTKLIKNRFTLFQVSLKSFLLLILVILCAFNASGGKYRVFVPVTVCVNQIKASFYKVAVLSLKLPLFVFTDRVDRLGNILPTLSRIMGNTVICGALSLS